MTTNLMTTNQVTQNKKRIAILDIGTVSTRLLIADCDLDGGLDGDLDAGLDGGNKRITQLYREARITNLGEGLLDSGFLSEQALNRVTEVVDAYLDIMRDYKMDVQASAGSLKNVLAVATSAARDASNSCELVDLLAKRGIELCVISGESEASIAFTGATYDFEGSNILVADIGGGSTELSFGDAAAVADAAGATGAAAAEATDPAAFAFSTAAKDISSSSPTMRKTHSFDVGCRRLTEMFLQDEPPNKDSLITARKWVKAELCSFFEGNDVEVEQLIAVAGTATSLIAILKQMERYDSSQVHKSTASRRDLIATLERLASMDLETRKQVVGLQAARASVIVAGLLILDVVMELAEVSMLHVSENDGMLGLLYEYCFA